MSDKTTLRWTKKLPVTWPLNMKPEEARDAANAIRDGYDAAYALRATLPRSFLVKHSNVAVSDGNVVVTVEAEGSFPREVAG